MTTVPLDEEIRDLMAFNNRFELLIKHEPGHLSMELLRERVNHMQEELDELKRAALSQDLAGQADALVDLVYVAKGTAVMMGLPWKELWNEVQLANMRKVPQTTARMRHDVVKPPGWRPPNIEGTLKSFGYDSTAWFDGNTFRQERCYDYEASTDDHDPRGA